MAKRCNTRTGCPRPRAIWWKDSLGVNWYGSGGGVTYNNPLDTALNTNGINQQVWGIIGDSIAVGTSSGEGPTPTAGTVYEWNGAAIVEVGANDLAGANTGSPWPKFGIDYHATSGKKPVFAQSALGGAEFYPNGDTNNYYTTGTLYGTAKTKIDAALVAAGTTRVRGIICILGINDIRGAQALADIGTGVTSLITRLNTDYSNPPIYFVIPGRSEGGYNSNRHQYVRRLLLNAFTTYSNVHIAGHLLPFANYGLYQGDNLHITQTGNDLLGEMMARYALETDTNRLYKSLMCQNRSVLSATQKAGIKTFAEAYPTFFDIFDCLQIHVNNTESDVQCDWAMMVSPQEVGTVTFSANNYIEPNGTNSYYRSHFLLDNTARSTITDFIEFAKTKVVTTPGSTSGYLFAKSNGVQLCRLYQGSSQLHFQAFDITDTVYATDTKFQDNTIYAIGRTSGNKLMKKDVTEVVNTAVANTGAITTQDSWVGAGNNNGVIQAPLQAQYQMYGLAKLSLLDWSTFVTNINNLLTAMQTP